MIVKYYTNRELSHKLHVNLSKWKRWSREFLPPDPLGGLQSGYARQYNPDDAFTVFLGGHLVANFKYTIPEARLILSDLQDWMVSSCFYFNYSGSAPKFATITHPVKHYQIYIFSIQNKNDFNSTFQYVIRGVLEEECLEQRGSQVRQERFVEIELNSANERIRPSNAESYHVLNMNVLRNNFLKLLQISGSRE